MNSSIKQSTKALPPGIHNNDSIVLFDGVCLLCLSWVKFIIRHDKKRLFKLASVQSPEGQTLLKFFNYSTEQFDTLIVIQGTQCLDETDAIFSVFERLSKPWTLLLIFKVIPKPIRNKLYRLLAQRRYQLFGKAESCLLPTADHASRFLNANP